MQCPNCDQEFVQNPLRKRQKFCSKSCGNLWRQRNVYKDRYTNEYRSATPRRFLVSLLQKKNHRREALDADFLTELYEKQEGLCALSGESMTTTKGEGRVMTNISIDRVDPGIGYERDNIQLVCLAPNLMKYSMSTDELKGWCGKILNHNPHNKSKKNVRVQSPSVNRSNNGR